MDPPFLEAGCLALTNRDRHYYSAGSLNIGIVPDFRLSCAEKDDRRNRDLFARMGERMKLVATNFPTSVQSCAFRGIPERPMAISLAIHFLIAEQRNVERQ
jgi:hypothetical protein